MRRIGNHILGASAASCELPERDYILTDLEGLDDYLVSTLHLAHLFRKIDHSKHNGVVVTRISLRFRR